MGIIQIIEKYDIQLPLNTFINVASLMKPRAYTISSSSLVYPNSIHMTISLIKGGVTSQNIQEMFLMY